MRVLVEREYPNTERHVRDSHRAQRWSMHAIDITILQMRGQRTVRIVPFLSLAPESSLPPPTFPYCRDILRDLQSPSEVIWWHGNMTLRQH